MNESSVFQLKRHSLSKEAGFDSQVKPLMEADISRLNFQLQVYNALLILKCFQLDLEYQPFSLQQVCLKELKRKRLKSNILLKVKFFSKDRVLFNLPYCTNKCQQALSQDPLQALILYENVFDHLHLQKLKKMFLYFDPEPGDC